MIIFLYGKDTYRSREKLKGIIEEYKKIHKSGISFIMIDFEEDDFEKLKNELETKSLFKDKKLIVLRNAFSDNDFSDKFLEYEKEKKDLGDNIIIFFEEGAIETKNPLYKFLFKKSQSQEFDFLTGEKLKNWAKKEFQKYKIEIEPKLIQMIIDSVGNDLWQLSNEIKKIATYKIKEGKIEQKDINLLVKSKIEVDIFKTIDEIAQNNKKQALSLLHKHLEKGDNPLYLLSMINFQFRNIITVKDLIEKNKPYSVILQQMKLHPFVVKKSYWQAQKFSFLELKKIYQKIFQVDLAIKTGKIDSGLALDTLIAEI